MPIAMGGGIGITTLSQHIPLDVPPVFPRTFSSYSHVFDMDHSKWWGNIGCQAVVKGVGCGV